MENASKALIMIAGVLLAMMVIALMNRTFNRMGEWATTQDEEVKIQQREKFNKEYEVYDKDLMYGVDVISCLNKAKSNDERINNRNYINGETYDESYDIEVVVKLSSNQLSHSITVYHISGSGTEKETPYQNGSGPQSIRKNFGELNFNFLKPTSKYAKLKEVAGTSRNKIEKDKNLMTITDAYIELDNTLLKLNKDTIMDSNNDVVKLLSASNTVTEIVKNTDYTTKNDPNGWTKVEFRSALYDLKTKKFTCENLEYNATTGRVSKIEFRELN